MLIVTTSAEAKVSTRISVQRKYKKRYAKLLRREKMQTQTNKKIYDLLEKYISRSNINYAIMIDGNWGNGKTYFIKNNVIQNFNKKFDDEKKCIYISLYGIDSCDEILKQIFIESSFLKKVSDGNIDNRIFGNLKGLSKSVLFCGLDKFNIKLDNIDYNGLINIDDSILFFDDFERSNIEINKLLGFINSFVEHESIPTILIGNQKEIINKSFNKNKELKYFLALDNRIDLEGSEESIIGTDEENEKNTYSITKINKRLQKIFSENDDYNRIKEKLVGIRIHYRPNLEGILEPLIEKNVKNRYLKKILNNNIKFIIYMINKTEHYNLRTLLFSFEKMSDIFDELLKIELDISFDLSSIRLDIFKYILDLSLEYKKNGKVNRWDADQTFKKIYYHDYSAESNDISLDNAVAFEFVYEYVLFTRKNIDEIKESITSYYDYSNNRNEDSIVKKFNSRWYISTEESVRKDYDNIVKLINEKKLDIHQMMLFLKIVFKLIDVGFKYNIHDVVNDIKETISDDKYDSKKYYPSTIPIPNGKEEKFKKIEKEILSEVKINEIKSYSNEINDLIENNKFSDFTRYIYNNKNHFENRQKFLELVNLSVLKNKLLEISSEDVLSIRRVFEIVYEKKRVDYSDDLSNLDEVKSEIEKIISSSKTDKIKEFQLGFLKDEISKYIKRFS